MKRGTYYIGIVKINTMDIETFTPVSILKKTRVNETANKNVRRERRAVVIVEVSETVAEKEEAKPLRAVYDPPSSNSSFCVKEEDNVIRDTSDSPPSLDPAPAPGEAYYYTN